MRNRWLTGSLIALLVQGALIAVAQNTAKTSHATIDCQKITYNWTSNKFEFSGRATIKVKGPKGDATIESPSVTGEGDLQASVIKQMKAAGPVHFDVFTKGPRPRHIVATCTRDATYSEETGVAVLSGNAKVVIDDVPKTPTSQSGELHGDKITMNMKTGEVNVTEGAHFEGDLPSKEAKE